MARFTVALTAAALTLAAVPADAQAPVKIGTLDL